MSYIGRYSFYCSSTSYEYSASFSTSTDPFTAGHASDIIVVGGGVDLIVSKAIAGMSEILELLVLSPSPSLMY